MSVQTIYKCDKCGKEQETREQFWVVGVSDGLAELRDPGRGHLASEMHGQELVTDTDAQQGHFRVREIFPEQSQFGVIVVDSWRTSGKYQSIRLNFFQGCRIGNDPGIHSKIFQYAHLPVGPLSTVIHYRYLHQTTPCHLYGYTHYIWGNSL